MQQFTNYQQQNSMQPIKQQQNEGFSGVQIEINMKGVYVRWNNGIITLYDFELNPIHNYQLQSVHFCLTQNPNIFLSVNSVGLISMINIETHSIEPFTTKQINTTNEFRISSFNTGLVLSFGSKMRTYGLENKNLVSIITSAHGDFITDVLFWRGLVVSCSQDGTCCIIDYTQGDDGIIDTINMEKPLNLITVYNDKYLSLVSDDNACLLYDGEKMENVFVIEDLRNVTIGNDSDGFTVLRGYPLNNSMNVALAGPNGELFFYQWINNQTFVQTYAHKYHNDMVRDYKIVNNMIFSVGDDGKVCKYQLLPQNQYYAMIQQQNQTQQMNNQFNNQNGLNGFREGFQRRNHRFNNNY